jgi:site-specific DNA-cytosine methylase
MADSYSKVVRASLLETFSRMGKVRRQKQILRSSNLRMRVLVACEFSGIVRDAFIERGHDAWSCDLLDTEGTRAGNHLRGNVLDALDGHIYKFRGYDIRTGNEPLFKQWDLLIAFPPCTHLAVSGARWFKEKKAEQYQAIEFVLKLMEADIPHIAIENPIGILSTHIRKPDQIIQPWQFGHGETKATCLWLKGLPTLKPTNIVEGRHARVHRASPGPDRWKERSRTLPGIASAMAEQWGSLPT